MRRLLYDTKLSTLTTNKQAAASEQNECTAPQKAAPADVAGACLPFQRLHACLQPARMVLSLHPVVLWPWAASTGLGSWAPSHRPAGSCHFQRVAESHTATFSKCGCRTARFPSPWLSIAFFRMRIYQNKDNSFPMCIESIWHQL